MELPGRARAWIIAVWIAALVIAMEGIANFRNVMFGYAVEQSRGESLVLGSSLVAWLRLGGSL